MRKRNLWSFLLALCMTLTLLPFGAGAVDKPKNAVSLPLNSSAAAEDGWYRFVPDSDAIYAITPAAEHFTITVYQSRLSASEIPQAEQQLAAAQQELEDGKQQLAEAQAMYDRGAKAMKESRADYQRAVEVLRQMRPEYEKYAALAPDSPELTDEARDFMAQYEDLRAQIEQYDDAVRQMEAAKQQLDDAYAVLAQREEELTNVKKLISASKSGKSGPMVYGADFTDQAIVGKFNRGSEFYIHLETDGSRTIVCEKLREAFVDVPEDQYYFSPVYWAALNDITNGTDATHFSPSAACTRGQIVTFLWRAAGRPAASGSNPFRDVSSDAYYHDAVLWAVSVGVTNGVDAKHFAPNAPCTRAQVVTFLWRLLDRNTVSGKPPFADVSKDAYYFSAVMWASGCGITQGTDATHFSPNRTCTRAQVVTFLFRAEENMRGDAATQGTVLSFGI